MGRSLRSGKQIASLSPPHKRAVKNNGKAKTTKAPAAIAAASAAKPRNEAKRIAPEQTAKKNAPNSVGGNKPTASKALARKKRQPKEESFESEEKEEETAKPGGESESGSSSDGEGESGSESDSESGSDDEGVKKIPLLQKSKVSPKKDLAKEKASKSLPKKEEEEGSSSEDESSSSGDQEDGSSSSSDGESDNGEARKEARAPLKKPVTSAKKEEGNSSSSNDSDNDMERGAPALVEKSTGPTNREESPGEVSNSGSDEDEVKTVPLVRLKKSTNSPIEKLDSSGDEDSSSGSGDDDVKKVAPSPLKKLKAATKGGSSSSSEESDDDEVEKIIPAPLKKSKHDESSDDDDDSSGASGMEESKETPGFTDENADWLKPKQNKKMKLMSSDEEGDEDDEFDAADSDDEEMLEVERQSRLVDAEMELEREEAESELRRTIAQETAVFHLPTMEELAEDEDRVVPPSELRARIDDVLEVLASFKSRREPGRSRSEYVERLGQDMAELFGYLQELVDYFMSMFGPNECLEFLEASERTRPLVVRVNTLKARRKDLAAALMKRGVRLDPLAPWSKVGLKIHESTVPVGATPEYLAGHYMLQSAASMCPVMALGVKPGDRVLDMSAAPGGKTSYISQLMRNKGVVIANDLKPERQKATVANLHRLGVRNAVTCCYDGRKIGLQMRNSFDRILLDAPCSGLGVISRDPSVKVQRTMPDVRRCAHLQKELLVAAIDALNHKSKKGGGYMVYSTCSVAVAENEEVVNYLLSKRDVKLVDTGLDFGKPGLTRFEHKRFHPSVALTRRFYPHVHNMDGFYVAKILKLSDNRKEEDKKEEAAAEKSSNEVETDDATKSAAAGSNDKKVDAEGGSQRQDAKTKKGKKKRGKPPVENGDVDRTTARKSKKMSYAPRATQQAAQNVPKKKKKTNAKVTKPRRMKITGM
eukprot:CAMPEP_0172530066 /NCGR_PEP_ID=MMETSP1067-20121228/3926_1 /TAXON_ID=265564 ORGANISM="Thalassiosira punctigera, Strain Tpunct2005C2" /NCGR_SAMPLE_ID=MMETSP1067 /ASSEMBLY_ACC=CAM_ASM_000444 /LENGTH=932 /DNA_ID=CAMNT_0013314209 /DNA_START=224 /DNA_END=3022 /DNA_ORIENTATION=-